MYWGLIIMNKVRFRTYWTAQLGLGNSLVGLRNIAQLGLRNFACMRNSQDCATPLAQLPGLRNSACATRRIAQLCLRNCF